MKYRVSRLVNKAYHALEKQEYSKAVGFLEQARSLDPECDEVCAYLGEAYVHNEEYEKALETFNKRNELSITAVHLNPYIEGYKGRIYFELGEIEKAKESIEQALSEDANDPEILYGKALLLSQKQQQKEAFEVMRNIDYYEPTFYYRKIKTLLKKIPENES